MTQPAIKHLWTDSEYLASERSSLEKHELLDGEVFAMAGGSPRHNALTISVGALLRSLARPRGCSVFSSDQRIYIPATGLFTYPDVSVVCGKPVVHDGDTIENPVLIVEVLSKSTQDYDRGAKFGHYRSILSLREVLFVTQQTHCVEHHRRLDSNQWLLSDVRQGAVQLVSLGGSLALDDIYEGCDDLPD
jgi:Uma2 family endonuclease